MAEEFDSIKALKGSVASFSGGVGSLLLIAIFVPALFGLTGEIEMAGKCHAYYDTLKRDDPSAPPDPQTPIYVAGSQTVQTWKTNHGLKLSFSDLTGSFIAVLAPLLSGSIVDLAKMTLG